MNTKIHNAINATLAADRYSLGAHWVYDEAQLKNLPINWSELNEPQSLWHKGKREGDYTHYGDHLLWLVEFVEQNREFDKEKYYTFWLQKMQDYSGYVDASSRGALEKIGAESKDLSICGRIAPLLLVSQTKEEFLKNVAAFVSITHNSALALRASEFFAQLLWEAQNRDERVAIIKELEPHYSELSEWINAALAKKDAPSFETIRDFGPACGIDGGFAGVIYLLAQEKSFEELMIENAKAGGDSSARAMSVAMILGISEKTEIPLKWQ